jgi:hypothetical protein
MIPRSRFGLVERELYKNNSNCLDSRFRRRQTDGVTVAMSGLFSVPASLGYLSGYRPSGVFFVTSMHSSS